VAIKTERKRALRKALWILPKLYIIMFADFEMERNLNTTFGI